MEAYTNVWKTFIGFPVRFFVGATSRYLKVLEQGNTVPRPKKLREAKNIKAHSVLLYLAKCPSSTASNTGGGGVGGLDVRENAGNAHIKAAFDP